MASLNALFDSRHMGWADAGGFGHMGWGAMLWWTALLVAVVVSFWLAARSRTPKQPSPMDLLAERFARGEIDAAEYEERKKTLLE